MRREEIGRRARTATAWLLRPAGQPPRLTAWAWAADAVLAVALASGAVVTTAMRSTAGESDDFPQPPPLPDITLPDTTLPDNAAPPTTPWQLVLAALTALPLVTRRRVPLVSFWVSAVAAFQLYQQLSGVDAIWTVVALVVAAYSASTYSRYRNLALVSVAVAALWIISGGGGLTSLPPELLLVLLLAAVGLAANAVYTLRERAQALQREQGDVARLAVERERTRLARELHDVVGHNVSVMVVQAGAARKVMDSTPELAREALLAVEAGGRAAMSELRQVVGLLTDDDGEADRVTQPGLAQLPELVARIRDAGVPVTLSVTGTVEPLPADVDLAAYRVVQEALTNTVKHAAGAAVTVDVVGAAEELRITVTDTGGAAPDATTPGGRGLSGLRERLAAYGGTLTAGRRATGGYQLVAAIPVRTAP